VRVETENKIKRSILNLSTIDPSQRGSFHVPGDDLV